MALSQSFPPKRDGKARPQILFQFTVLKRPLSGFVPGTRRHLCLRGLTWRVGMRLIWVASSLLVAVSPPVLLSQEEKGGLGVSTPDVPEPSTSSSSSSSTSATFQVGMLFKFFDQW